MTAWAVFDAGEQLAVDAWNLAADSAVAQYNTAAQAAVDAWNQAEAVAVAAYNSAAQQAADAYNQASQAATDAYNNAEQIATDAWNAAALAAANDFNQASQQATDALTLADNAATAQHIAALNAAIAVWNTASQAATDAYNAAVTIATDAWNQAEAAAVAVRNQAAQTAVSTFNSIIPGLQAQADQAYQEYQDAVANAGCGVPGGAQQQQFFVAQVSDKHPAGVQALAEARGLTVAEYQAQLQLESAVTKLTNLSRSALQKIFTKHGKDFKLAGNWSNNRTADVLNAIRQHMERAGTKAIQGTYRGQKVLHYVDPKTGLNVMTDVNGNFIGGWQLSVEQLTSVLNSGRLF